MLEHRVTYRPDIDGLRALAVTAVLLYHANFSLGKFELFAGGYLGVDVFFVISGFLITQNIIYTPVVSKVSYLINFYLRRARRILPSLFVIVLVTQVITLFLGVPEKLRTVAYSSLATFFSVSNYYWLNFTSTYASSTTQTEPLLHTWTLGVEEQFYLLLPAIFLLTMRKKAGLFRVAIAILATVSLLYCLIFGLENPNENFYSLWTRAWELGVGSILALNYKRLSSLFQLNRFTIGFCLFGLVTFLLFFPINDLHPGLWTIIPVLCTAVVILHGGGLSFVNIFLTKPSLVETGKMSYSIYLVHFPIFAFFRQYFSSSNLTDILLVLVCIFVAFLLNRAIENPFRNAKRFSTFKLLIFLGSAALAILLTAFASLSIANSLDKARDFNFKELLESRWDYTNLKLNVCNQSNDSVLCTKNVNTVLVVGDSMVPDAVRIIGMGEKNFNFIANTQGGCVPTRETPIEVRKLNNLKECSSLNRLRFDTKYYEDIDKVAIITSLSSPERLTEYVSFLKRQTHVRNILLFGPYLQLDTNISELISKWNNVEQISSHSNFSFDLRTADRNFRIFADLNEIGYVSPYSTLCIRNSCPLFFNEHPFTSDTTHWTTYLTKELYLKNAQYLETWGHN